MAHMTLPTTTSAPPFSPAAASTEARSDRASRRPLTFEERFCSHHQCDAAEFRRTVFWRCIPGRMRPLATLVWACRRSYFDLEHRLLDEIAKARCIDDIQLDTHDYRQDPASRRFARQTLRLRLSCARLVDLARGYLPQRYGSLPPW
jgi:hypothetical protein